MMEGHLDRGGVARRHAAARPAHRHLRRQPRHAVGDDRPDVPEDVGGRFEACGWHVQHDRRPRRRRRRCGARFRARRGGSAVADRRAHPHRLRQPEEAGHVPGTRRAARRRRSTRHQARARVAGRAAVPRARRGARQCFAPRGERGPELEAEWRRRVDAHEPRTGRRGRLRARPGGRVARRLAGASAHVHARGRRPCDARRRRQGAHRARERSHEPRRRLRGSQSVDEDGDWQDSATSRARQQLRLLEHRRRRAPPAASGVTPGATSTLACASTRWPPPSPGWPCTAASCRTAPRSCRSPTTCARASGWRR